MGSGAISARPGVTRPLVIAHRGAAGDAPESTMAAFELALRQGADAIEFDVHLSADGVPVVIHDARLERTTSGAGLVSEHSVAALKRLDAGAWYNCRHPAKAHGAYVRQRIPLLSELLAWVRERHCLAYLELKAGSDVYPGIERKVLDEIHRAGVSALTTVISFDFAAVRCVRELDGKIRLGTSFKRPALALRRARLVAAGCLLPHWALASRRLVSRAHASGLQVVVWTANQGCTMRRKILDGVDGIITDYPGRLVEVRNFSDGR